MTSEKEGANLASAPPPPPPPLQLDY